MSIYRYIQNVADNVIDTYDSVRPLDIVKNLKRVEFKVLPLTNSINGFYKYISPNRQMIVINENLSEEMFNFTLFHELAHYFLGHKNTLLLNSSFTSTLKEEFQADLYATYMYLHYIEAYTSCSLEEVSLPKRVNELIHYFY
ncbi:MAG: ImmA/IrrE family metallo-endopeptidase [Clostridium celatum]|uniref:ImmA/IrrE family metallo-endopeptidase n=1 Tax=Clostridium TaxID=1485 RepID=UPI0008215CE4|nr:MULTISPECIES: ImmA/IrrE family metallo-endopeptidase [Clostridium]MDU2121411.1 ImmA/IrrE family metallo-endopeptidase [Clostridium celatum]MDU4977950.1 ImmA/IrrE family metallo-endopeptidase [Clostridium celatum]MEE0728813.1 ImmA/IrrE family metallo-endopeptidase [Clostridium saudiense]SCJ62123.1 phage exclusion protein Lit [uncultured Clostridium sp.]